MRDEPDKQERFLRLGEEYFWFLSQNAIVERVLGRRLALLEGGRRPLRLLDVVVAIDVLEHIEDDRAALREIARALRPGGVFVFAVPAFMALWRHHDVWNRHFRRYVRAEFIAKVLGVGLTRERGEYIKCAFFTPLLAIVLAERVGPRCPAARQFL